MLKSCTCIVYRVHVNYISCTHSKRFLFNVCGLSSMLFYLHWIAQQQFQLSALFQFRTVGSSYYILEHKRHRIHRIIQCTNILSRHTKYSIICDSVISRCCRSHILLKLQRLISRSNRILIFYLPL